MYSTIVNRHNQRSPHQQKQPKKRWLNSQSHFHPSINPSIFPRLRRLCPVMQFPRRGKLALGTSRCLGEKTLDPKGFQNWANRSQQLCVIYQFFLRIWDAFLYIPSPLARISEASTAPYASKHRTWGGMTGRLKHTKKNSGGMTGKTRETEIHGDVHFFIPDALNGTGIYIPNS